MLPIVAKVNKLKKLRLEKQAARRVRDSQAIATCDLPPMPEKLIPVFEGEARYRGAFGGRGSGKSANFARMLAVRGYEKPRRILCARELQKSIKDSVHAEIVNAIESLPWLKDHYNWGENFIRGLNGTEFIFRGLRHNYQEIKSLSGIDICWIEEAEAVSEASWKVLIPTIRKDGSEIWVTWNPESEDSPVRQRMILNPAPGTKVVQLNYLDNPWFPEVLEQERRHMLATDPDLYTHVWEGECLTRSNAQILGGKWIVEDFEPQPHWEGPYFGADWGFSQDPTTLVKCWIANDSLYIERESYRIGLEIDQTASVWREEVPGCDRYTIRADCSRPESISYVNRNGIPGLCSVEKWPGSVEDGIKRLRAFKQIVIHSRCTYTQQEARLYSYKVDRLTGDILPVIVDKHNHIWDAVRYALAPIIRNGSNGFSQGRASWGR